MADGSDCTILILTSGGGALGGLQQETLADPSLNIHFLRTDVGFLEPTDDLKSLHDFNNRKFHILAAISSSPLRTYE